MTREPGRLHGSRILLLLAAFWIASLTGATGQVRPQFVAGEIVLYCQPGTQQATVNALAAKVNAQTVTPLLLADCYKLTLQVRLKTNADTLTAVAALKGDPSVRWVGANRLYYLSQAAAATVEPNDPHYTSGEQWNLKLINMPQAWALQKGASNINVSVIDTGVDITQEDLRGRISTGSFDVADNDSDVSPDGTYLPYSPGPPPVDFENQHGEFISGIIAANTNNSTGIAAVDWQNTQIVFVKIVKKGTSNLDSAAIINAYAYLLKNYAVYHVVAVNMSYGGTGDPTDTNSPEYVGIKALSDAGVIMVASAGNDAPLTNTQQTPAAFPFVLSVGSVGRTGKLAYYSQSGKVDIAAPGGDESNAIEDGIISTLTVDTNHLKSYDFQQGTSYASPHVVAALALLLAVPGMTPTKAVSILKSTANRTNLTSVPDPAYGYGVIDVGRAMTAASTAISLIEPVATDVNGNSNDPSNLLPPIETFKPVLRFKVNNVAQTSITATVKKYDASNNVQATYTIPTSAFVVETGSATSTYPAYTLAVRVNLADPALFGSNAAPTTGSTTASYRYSVAINGTGSGQSVSDERFFNVTPHKLTGFSVTSAAGVTRNLAMISVPYYESAADSPTGAFRDAPSLFASIPPVTLYRYKYNQGNAAGYSVFSTTGDDFAKLRPAQNPAGTNAATDVHLTDTDLVTGIQPTDYIAPVGLAWFADLPASGLSVSTYGANFSKQAVSILLNEGWNMVGDPYPFPIALSSALIETGSGNRIPIGTATDQNLLLPYIYRYVGGDYQFQPLNGGALQPWEGHWIYVTPQVTGTVNLSNHMRIIFFPTPIPASGRAAQAALTTRAVNLNGTSGWTVQLEAHTATLKDAYNFVGMTSSAQPERSRVPKPPKPSPYVSLGILKPDSAAGVYAQDLQVLGGTKNWELVVSTDQPDADVTVNWPSASGLPRNYRLTLTDKATGQAVDLRQQRSYQYNSGRNAANRLFTLTAQPTRLGGRALFSNVVVTPSGGGTGRSAQAYEIGYTVSQEAQVEVTVLSASGRSLAKVGATRAATSGDNRVIWNGTDSAGRVLPGGTYVVQLRAVTADGEVTREVRSLLITGR